MAFLFGTLPGMENFYSESDSISDAETTTTTIDSNAETTTIDLNTEPNTLDSNSETITGHLNLPEHTPLTPESLDDISLGIPASPIVNANSGSISPNHNSPPSPQSHQQSNVAKTTTQIDQNKISISKPKITKKPTKPAPQPSPNNITLSKPKIVKKVLPSPTNTPSNKKVISKPEIAKKNDTSTKGTPQVVNGKNIKISAKKGLESSDTTPKDILKNKKKPAKSNGSIGTPNLFGNKKVLPSKSQSEKTSTNVSSTPSSRKRPSTQESTKADIKVPKLVNSSKNISKSLETAETLKQSKNTSQTKSVTPIPILSVPSKKLGLTSKTTKNKDGLMPVKPTLQRKTPKAVPIQLKLRKKPASEKPSIKNSEIKHSVVKIKLNQASSAKPKASQSANSIKPSKGVETKPKGKSAKQSPHGTTVSKKTKTSLKNVKQQQTKGMFKKPLPVSSGTVNFTIDPSSSIEIHTSPYLDQSESKSEKFLNIKLEPNEEPPLPNSSSSPVLQTYAKGEWEWMDGDPIFSPEIDLIRLEDCMCLN